MMSVSWWFEKEGSKGMFSGQALVHLGSDFAQFPCVGVILSCSWLVLVLLDVAVTEMDTIMSIFNAVTGLGNFNMSLTWFWS